jgi:hypothetical protein
VIVDVFAPALAPSLAFAQPYLSLTAASWALKICETGPGMHSVRALKAWLCYPDSDVPCHLLLSRSRKFPFGPYEYQTSLKTTQWSDINVNPPNSSTRADLLQ